MSNELILDSNSVLLSPTVSYHQSRTPQLFSLLPHSHEGICGCVLFLSISIPCKRHQCFRNVVLLHPILSQSRTVTLTQGIRNCSFSNIPFIHSKTLLPFGSFRRSAPTPPVAILRFTPSIAALASDPPVPLSADTAKPAVWSTASVRVAFPLSTEVAASVIVVDAPDHRGSNQSASKSRRENVMQQRRKLPVVGQNGQYPWHMCRRCKWMRQKLSTYSIHMA